MNEAVMVDSDVFDIPGKDERILCPNATCRHPYTAGVLGPGTRLHCKCSRCKEFFWIFKPASGEAAYVEEQNADSRKTIEPGRTADNADEAGVSRYDNPGKHVR